MGEDDDEEVGCIWESSDSTSLWVASNDCSGAVTVEGLVDDGVFTPRVEAMDARSFNFA